MRVQEGDYVRITRGKWIGRAGYVSEVDDAQGAMRVCVEIDGEEICVPSNMIEQARVN